MKVKHRKVKESVWGDTIEFRGKRYYWYKIVRGMGKARQIGRELVSRGYKIRLIPIRTIFGATGEIRIYTSPKVSNK